jgi:mRNA interferase MazF
MTPSYYPKQGEVYWIELDPAVGSEMRKTRPCLVVTANDINRRRQTVVVIPVSTTSPQGLPLYVPLPSVSERSQAVIDQIRVVDKTRLGDWKANISVVEMENIFEAMGLVFAIK